MEFKLADAKLHHCGALARKIRAPQAQGMASIGLRTHAELRLRFAESAYRRAWFIDGRLAALGGVTGPRLSTTGIVWLALSEECAKYPRQTALTARAQLAEILKTREEVFTLMLPGDRVAWRWVEFLGFEGVEQPKNDDGTIWMRRPR